MRREDLTDGEGGRGRRIDDPHARAGDLLDARAQERVVRAAEEERVDRGPHDRSLREKRLDVLAHRGLGLVGIGLAGLDERDEPRAGLLDHVDERVQVAQRVCASCDWRCWVTSPFANASIAFAIGVFCCASTNGCCLLSDSLTVFQSVGISATTGRLSACSSPPFDIPAAVSAWFTTRRIGFAPL